MGGQEKVSVRHLERTHGNGKSGKNRFVQGKSMHDQPRILPYGLEGLELMAWYVLFSLHCSKVSSSCLFFVFFVLDASLRHGGAYSSSSSGSPEREIATY